MKKLQNLIIAISALVVLTGCGNSTGDRALSGAGIGAGVGAVGGAIVAGDPVDGALIGGAVGGAAGGLTSNKDIDLGKPIWR